MHDWTAHAWRVPLFVVLAMCARSARAGPEGTWRLIDEKTGHPRAEVELTIVNHKLKGHIVRGLRKDDRPGDRCERCSDDRRNQPLVGLEILRDLEPEKEGTWWTGGTLLDPEDGQVYRARLRVSDDDQQIQVRGYVSVFYRTQHWQRVMPGERFQTLR